jgi:hypothetical protein
LYVLAHDVQERTSIRKKKKKTVAVRNYLSAHEASASEMKVKRWS